MVFNGISLLKCVADFVLQKQREKSYNVIDHIIDQMYSLWKVEPYHIGNNTMEAMLFAVHSNI